ncbi:FAD-binding domain-containing protein [Punctularia strigosozonata HHB-11173 SS5]|uniref:FAD-binding domain-containing protein n=1 Tax=Punctularia strigosozonata (strain HHB-11173) TaxID=741275 RepID=UPI00044168CF|nr:FAD-binding domain-containing protein [Punctularia strigosozonata HHB-11173 SS5]EIN11997.1 FAD-binding domain-containing protein [Punctularia strigosozonata HHB-11173 SS5]
MSLSLRCLFIVPLAFKVAASLASSNPGSVACTSLLGSLGGAIVQSSGAQYDATATGAWNLFNDEQTPGCIVFPRNASQVQTAMSAIFSAGSTYSIQSGGHSHMIGWNNVDQGVLISFSEMASISYDAPDNSIIIGPGARWGNVYTTTAQFGVAPIGGRQADVGTSLLLGGGLSFLSPTWGYAADQIKALDVVLVNGTLLTATATNSQSDLFRALKGGGSRFGIYANSSLEAVLNATADYVASVSDPKATLLTSIINSISNGVNTPTILVNVFYNGTSLPDSIFGSFQSIPSVSKTLGSLSYLDIVQTLPSGAAPPGTQLGQHDGAAALPGSRSALLDAHRHFLNFTTAVADNLNQSLYTITPVLQPQIDAGRAMGGNAISPPDGGFASVQFAQTFKSGVTQKPAGFQDAFNLMLEQIPNAPGKPLFLDECDELQDVYSTYGDFAALQQTYAKYDPTRFNVQHMAGPVGL